MLESLSSWAISIPKVAAIVVVACVAAYLATEILQKFILLTTPNHIDIPNGMPSMIMQPDTFKALFERNAGKIDLCIGGSNCAKINLLTDEIEKLEDMAENMAYFEITHAIYHEEHGDKIIRFTRFGLLHIRLWAKKEIDKKIKTKKNEK